MASKYIEAIEAEFAKRLAHMSDDEVMALLERSPRAAQHPHGVRQATFRPPPAQAQGPQPLTIGASVLEVVRQAARPLTSNEIVQALEDFRPNTPEASSRSEISRLASSGQLRLHGSARAGGTYSTARASTMRPMARLRSG